MAEETTAVKETAAKKPADQADRPAGQVAYAECVLCRRPTEYPETVKGATLCPACEWQEAQRNACSG